MKKYIVFTVVICLSLFVIYKKTKLHDEDYNITASSYGVDLNNLSDIALELPEGAPEILLTLKGKLRLKPCPVEQGDPIYCWFLQMDKHSFKIAAKTPVWGYGIALKDIMDYSNWFEIQLGRDRETEEFCLKHANQKVTVEGFLFHAHTGHHHSPFLMDLKKIYK